MKIKEGDRVLITFASHRGVLEGIVEHSPQATGDSWHISSGDTLHYVQLFERMELTEKGTHK